MVNLWPWRGDDSSTASFEKTLSTLSKKIADTQRQLDKLRSNSRRAKVLWILYLAFAYLVYAIVLLLVVGYKNLGPWEWTGMAGGPVVIYLVRALTNGYFNFRIESLEARLKEQQDDRAKTIQKLKEATRYDSTLQLLEKYGGEKHRRSLSPDDATDPDAQKKGGAPPSGHPAERPTTPQIRTTHAPPPTANIQGPPSRAGTPHSQLGQAPPPFMGSPQPPSRGQTPLSSYPDHASNAGGDSMPPAAYHQYDYSRGPPQWYDRVLDLMLGEDETAPRNRIVLICSACRLVNGQAPPGTRALADVGRWKCMGCGAMNGELDEGKKIMNEVLGKQKQQQGRAAAARRDDSADEREGESHGALDEGDDFGDHGHLGVKKRGSR